MDFSLTTLFVLPTTVTLPTSGGPQDLLPGQFGIYRNDYSVATAGNVAAAKYIYLKQGRTVTEPGLGTKGSDRIYEDSIVEDQGWYKIPSDSGFSNQVTEISDFQMKYDTNYSITLRLFSNYTNVGFYEGMTRSVTIMTPCLDCGDDPCSALSAGDIQDAVDDFVAQINADHLLSQLVVAERMGTGATSSIRITGKALPTPATRQNPYVNRQQFDRLKFFTWAYEGAETSQDPELFYEKCAPVAQVEVKQRAMWPRGTSAEVKELEKQYFSYQSTFKNIFADSDWNNTFQSEVVDGVFYDFYYLKFKQRQQQMGYHSEQHMDQTVLLAVPAGQTAGLEAILTAFLGAPINEVATNVSTTSTTSTTSTSTSSTTIIIP